MKTSDIKRLGELYRQVVEGIQVDNGYTEDEVRDLCHSKDHDCAVTVKHPQWGLGKPVYESHAIPDDNGVVAWYDVQFKHGVEKEVPAEDMEILVSEDHKMNAKKHKKDDKVIKGQKEDNTNDKSDDGDGLDKVQPKAVKKKFKDRKDKDIDNDGDVDSSDEYLHKRRKAVSKAMKDEGNAFTMALKNAKDNGDEEFVVAGKKYKVKDVEEDIKFLKVNEARKVKEEEDEEEPRPIPVPPKKKKEKDEDEDEVDSDDQGDEEEGDDEEDAPKKDKKDDKKKNGNPHTSDKTPEISKIETVKKECMDEKDFKPHKMYKGDKEVMAKTYADHVKYDKMGYVHEKPVKEDIDKHFAEMWEAIEAISEKRKESQGATDPEGIMDKESPKSKEFVAKHGKDEKENDSISKDNKKGEDATKPKSGKRKQDSTVGEAKTLVDLAREVLSGKNPNAFEEMKGSTLEDVSKKENKVKNPYDGRTRDAKAFLERMAKRNGK